jgi:hypothetical protein
MPSAESGLDQKHALEAHWRKWVFPLPGIDRLVALHFSSLPNFVGLSRLKMPGSAQFRPIANLAMSSSFLMESFRRVHKTKPPTLQDMGGCYICRD